MFKIRRRGTEVKAVETYLEILLGLLRGSSKIKEESPEGLLMQIALLEKFKEDIGNIIDRLKNHFNHFMEEQIEK